MLFSELDVLSTYLTVRTVCVNMLVGGWTRALRLQQGFFCFNSFIICIKRSLRRSETTLGFSFQKPSRFSLCLLQMSNAHYITLIAGVKVKLIMHSFSSMAPLSL